MARNPTPQNLLRQLPKKWAAALVLILIAYTLAQPFANSRLGWHLPGLADLLETGKPADERPVVKTERSATAKKFPTSDHVDSAVAEEEANHTDTEAFDQATRSKSGADQAPPGDSKLLYGLLKDAGREVYISPAGLRYTRGGEEGHRLKHLERHLHDIPDRPGKHGVFDGDMAQTLRWIDDAYERGRQGAKGVRKRDEDRRTVYEVPFSKSIGYVGGRDGKREHNPESKRLRLVVDGDQVITAFPF